MPENKPSHGGARSGAGRKPSKGPTKTLTLRIPVSDLEILQGAGITNLSRFYVDAGAKAARRLKT